jgi:hypothetical protein
VEVLRVGLFRLADQNPIRRESPSTWTNRSSRKLEKEEERPRFVDRRNPSHRVGAGMAGSWLGEPRRGRTRAGERKAHPLSMRLGWAPSRQRVKLWEHYEIRSGHR